MQTTQFKGVATTVRQENNGWLIGRYQLTDVAAKQHDKIHLNTGGWFTTTTKRRMNQFAYQFCDNAFSVYQKNYQWFALIHATNESIPFNGNTCDFDLSMSLELAA
jgi:hypothetical protein